MTALLSILYIGIQELTQDYIASRLQHDADSLVSALTLQSDGSWSIHPDKTSSIYNRVHSGHYYVVTTEAQTFRSRSLFDINVTIPPIAFGETKNLKASGPGNEQWLIWLQKVKKKNQPITLWVAEDITPLQQNLNRFFVFALAAVLTTIALLLILQYRLLQKGFERLDQVRDAISQLHLGARDLPFEKLPSEVQPLIDEIQRLLNQLSQRVQRSRNALGNVAHELKRPLQQLQSQTENLPPEQKERTEIILNDIHRIIERELKRARIVGIASPGRHTVIDEDMPHLIEIMHSIYPKKSIITNYAQNITLPYDRDDLLELLGNLIDNACKHATENVHLNIANINQHWLLTIEDDGEGVTQTDLHAIVERGIRLDESFEGHGLGLSICKDIIESYSGKLSFDQSKLGGLKVSIALPEQLLIT